MKPLKQDDGANPVCSIAYSPECKFFVFVFDFKNILTKKCEIIAKNLKIFEKEKTKNQIVGGYKNDTLIIFDL